MSIYNQQQVKSGLAALALFAFPLVVSTATVDSDEERGLEIALEADRRDDGFGDMTAGLTMILRNRHGQESRREIRSRTLEVEGDGDKSLVIFDRPRDVQGTVLLTFTHKTGSDDQ